MELKVDIYNSITGIGWAVVAFLLGGMLINRKRGGR